MLCKSYRWTPLPHLATYGIHLSPPIIKRLKHLDIPCEDGIPVASSQLLHAVSTCNLESALQVKSAASLPASSHTLSRLRAAIFRETAVGIRVVSIKGPPERALIMFNAIFKSDAISKSLYMSKTAWSQTRPRYIIHTILHALMRIGMIEEAAQYGCRLISTGFTLHWRTLEILIRNLTTHTISLPKPSHKKSLSDTTKLAIRLLVRSWRSGLSLTTSVYVTLMQACCAQNHPLLAASIFDTLVRKSRRRCYKYHLKKGRVVHKVGQTYSLPPPTYAMMQPILDYIISCLTGLNSVKRGEQASIWITPALKALLKLAALMNEDLLPFPNISLLIKALYHTPRSNLAATGSLDQSSLTHNTYEHSHESLLRLILSLANRHIQPLDLRSCNSLLHYSLRHRRSPALAGRVLRYMYMERKPPLEPDVDTSNILLRSTTLLRNGALPDYLALALSNSHELLHSSPATKFVRSCALFVDAPLVQEPASLVARITHLISVGRAFEIPQIVYELFPGLSLIRPESSSPEVMQAYIHDRKVNSFAAVRHAARLGPHVLSSLLNGLVKSGKTGLMGRVWFVATQAEIASWSKSIVPDVKPWRLSIHSYTSMMQSYASEHKKGMYIRRRTTQESPVANPYVRGWAFELSEEDESRPLLRYKAAQELAFRLYSSLKNNNTPRILQTPNGPLSVRHPVGMAPPSPDARFFNAALDLFSREQGMRQRVSLSSNKFWRDKYYQKAQRFLDKGHILPYSNLRLLTVLRDMIEYGHPIPHGYKVLLVGQPSIRPHHSPIVPQPPYSFPPQTTPPVPKPFHLHTPKTRGMSATTKKVYHRPASDN